MKPGQVRMPVVAGQFYEGGATSLTRQIEQCYLSPLGPGRLPAVNRDGPRRIVGLVSPHAGYFFSGPTAAHGYSALGADGQPGVIVIVGLNHGRLGHASAVQTAGAWRTPLSDAVVDHEVAARIAEPLKGFSTDASAFAGEHSLEVQLPFLQDLYEEVLRFVPVMMAAQDLFTAEAVGHAIAAGLEGRDAAIVASTDMTHYESPDTARRQDRLLIERIEAMDHEGLISTQQARGISMCGVGPVAAMLIAAKALGATQARTLAYSTSGDVMPSPQVVGYLSAVVTR
ncbi:MAG TPA: AmmeMemoRadiSam system protein B [Armatimonadota bacterium]|nr:AmmeMemoRadiSam system protein B [Armatimonadota bacterium]